MNVGAITSQGVSLMKASRRFWENINEWQLFLMILALTLMLISAFFIQEYTGIRIYLLSVGLALLIGVRGRMIRKEQGISRLVVRNRSFRRFQESDQISYPTLESLIRLARYAASAANRQPLRFCPVNEPDVRAKIFPTLGWAGYLTDWKGPDEGERPAAYILILGDKERGNQFKYDAGLAAQNILLGAVARGLGGCILASIQRDQLRDSLNIDSRYEILLILALGKPGEEVVVEDMGGDGDFKYWRDEQGVHHVPKRRLDDLILKLS